MRDIGRMQGECKTFTVLHQILVQAAMLQPTVSFFHPRQASSLEIASRCICRFLLQALNNRSDPLKSNICGQND